MEENDALNLAKISAEMTHNYPEGIKGASPTESLPSLAAITSISLRM